MTETPPSSKVAALFVSERGPYASDLRFDAWGIQRDARTYGETRPVVAHPPCERWASVRLVVREDEISIHGVPKEVFEALPFKARGPVPGLYPSWKESQSRQGGKRVCFYLDVDNKEVEHE